MESAPVRLLYYKVMNITLMRLVILACSKTFGQKPIPENRAQNRLRNRSLAVWISLP